MSRMMYFVLLFVFSSVSVFAEQIKYASKNINWGRVVESDVNREEIVKSVPSGGLSVASVSTETIETRVLTLESGSKIKITERIEVNEDGEEDRIFQGGENLSEIRVVASIENAEEVLSLLRANGCSSIKRYGKAGRIFRARIPQQSEAATAELLSKISTFGVLSAEKSQVKFYVTSALPATLPNDVFFDRQWSLERIGVTNVWGRGYFGFPNIPCAVFDTGVHLSHEDLQQNVKRRVSALFSSADPEDHHGHGSHCLGIMGADGNNGKGITGVGQVANLTSIRGPISYWEEGDDILDGFQWALDNGIKILSCSFGTPPGTASYDAAEFEILNDLGAAGCLVVIAAGNDGNDNDRVPAYPASYNCDNIISVVCTNERDIPANRNENGWNTSYGAASCDIGAPGTDILSCTRDADNAYEAWSGTSMATPLVAACAAMVWERNPSWNYRDVRDRLFVTADPMTSLSGYCKTGARVNLDRALDPNSGFITVAPLKKAYVNDETITLSVKASPQISRVNVTLRNRDDAEFSIDLGSFDLTPGVETQFSVWTPGVSNKNRGYIFRVDAENDPSAFAYSTVFRVKYGDIPETITVSAPVSNAELDADNLPISFFASDAVFVSLAIESFTTNGIWELEATLGDVAATPGIGKTVYAHLVGRGWIRNRPYRILVRDLDDESVFGYSDEFHIVQSTGSVYLMSGNPGVKLGEGDAAWQTEYRADSEIRITCWMPDVSLYWLYLVPVDGKGGTKLIKQTWVDQRTELENGQREYRTFAFAVPDEYADGRQYYLRLLDAFAPEMFDASPAFTILPRADGKKTPTFAEAMGDSSEREYNSQCLWYPEPIDENSWMLRSAWIGRDEVSWFETTVEGPCQLQMDMRVDSLAEHGIMTISYTKPPILETSSIWTQLARRTGNRDWEHLELDIPTGTYTIRWVYKRDSEPTTSGENSVWVKNMKFVPIAKEVGINLNGNVLSFSGGMEYPGYIVYSLDGSMPTQTSQRWVPGQSVSLHQSTLIRARAYKDGFEPGKIAERFYVNIPGDGTLTSPYVIENARDWQAFASNVNNGNSYNGKRIILAQDIDCSGISFISAGYSDESMTHGERAFQGFLDGQGFSLVNPEFSGSGTDSTRLSVGLFGNIGRQGVVSNLVVRSPKFKLSARDAALATSGGGIAARNSGKIANCFVINADFYLSATLGGISGVNTGEISDCFFSGKLAVQQDSTTDELCLGGITGIMERNNSDEIGKIYRSVAHSELSIIVTSSYPSYIGGIAGRISGGPNFTCEIADAGATYSIEKNNITGGTLLVGQRFGRTGNLSEFRTYGVELNLENPENDTKEGLWLLKDLGENTWENDLLNINAGYPVIKRFPTFSSMITAPHVTPNSTPYTDDFLVIATPAEPNHLIRFTTDGSIPNETSLLYTNSIPVTVDNEITIFIFRSFTADTGEKSAPVKVIYNSYNKIKCSRIFFSSATEDGNPGGQFNAGTPISIPPLEVKIHLDCPTPGAWITYTLDGSEPSETSRRYSTPFDLTGSGQIKAKAFYPPWYDAGPTGERSFDIIQADEYKAQLTLVDARKLSGTYWSETFTILANPPPLGKVFSHWLITGPLVLENSKTEQISFQWLTKESITLKAIYVEKQGFSLYLK